VKSHLRKEKDCLNCGAEISDRYCSHCGQENLIPQESVADLVSHFVSDLFHYDSKFLTTIRDLLFKPGFLTQEYLKGRRMGYLNPVRMYLFISFIFFLLLFAQKHRENDVDRQKPVVQNPNPAKQFLADSLKKSLLIRKSPTVANLTRDSLIRDIALKLDTPIIPVIKDESIGFSISGTGFLITLVENKYERVSQYDSAQKALPTDQRDGFIWHFFIRNNVRIKEKYGSSSKIVVNEGFQHNVPKLMFILLPFFALLLLLFYRKKNVTYAGHIIFSFHYHSFAFLLLLTTNLITLILPFYKFDVAIVLVSLFLLFLYLTLALKNVYGQGLMISTLKALVISFLYLLSLVLSLWIWLLILFFTT
jgi:hypothetical protein